MRRSHIHVISVDIDGVSVVGRIAIEASGDSAQNDAASAFLYDRLRQDAYRHYLWNFRAVRNVVVHLIQDGRIRSTRIYTTNRELATNILRRYPSLNGANPTASQLATALNLRNNFFNELNEWFYNFELKKILCMFKRGQTKMGVSLYCNQNMCLI